MKLRKFAELRWQEFFWYFLFVGLYAWSSHAIVYNNDGLGVGGGHKVQWPCDAQEARGVSKYQHAFINHRESVQNPILCSSVCALGRLSFWIASVSAFFYLIMDDKSRKIYKWFLLAASLGMVGASSVMNRPLAIRSIPAYLCLGFFFSIDFTKSKKYIFF